MSDVDQILADAMRSVTGGLDLGVVEHAMTDLCQAWAKQAAALKDAKYVRRRMKFECKACKAKNQVTLPGPDPTEISKAAVNSIKAGDTMARLVEFMKGKPDSRPDTGAEWLKHLTSEQLQTVQGWVEAATARK